MLPGTELSVAVSHDINLRRIEVTTAMIEAGIICKSFSVSTAAAVQHYPVTLAAAQAMVGVNQADVAQLMTQAKTYVLPAIQYFHTRFNHCDSKLYQAIRLFKAVRILDPAQADRLRIGAAHVEGLRVIPALDKDETIAQLLEKLPAYLIAAEEATVDEETTHLQWWNLQRQLPDWQGAARIVFTLLPSSAPAESILAIKPGKPLAVKHVV